MYTFYRYYRIEVTKQLFHFTLLSILHESFDCVSFTRSPQLTENKGSIYVGGRSVFYGYDLWYRETL